jgi:subtilisin family serine protease
VLALAFSLVVSHAHALAVERAADDRPVVAVILLDTPPLASYRGGIRGLAATAAAANGAARLDLRSPAARAYRAFLEQRLGSFESLARAAVPDAQLLYRYTVVLGGVALQVHESDLATLATLPGVRQIIRDQAFAPDTNVSPKLVGAPKLWKTLGGQSAAGEGVVVGILDTGVWPEHPSFADPDPSGKPYPPPPPTWNHGAGPDCQAPSDGSPPLGCSNKLIGARHFLAAYRADGGFSVPGEFDSARDQDGHGTHTATIAAGNAGVHAVVLGVDRGVISGIAPRAHVAVYRVCGLPPSGGGCHGADTAAAVGQAIEDGVDVMNFSISGGTSPYTEAAQKAFLDAYDAGVFISTSAGNGGPRLGTVNNLQPWTATVANTSETRIFRSEVQLKGDVTGKLTLPGRSMTGGFKGSVPLVDAADFGDEFCAGPFAAGTVDGAMVACRRGGTSWRTTKSRNVMLGGAAGMLLYQTAAFSGALRELHFVPALHLDNAASDRLLPFLFGNDRMTAKFAGLKATKTTADVLASRSSRGGPLVVQGIMKPDLAAPGTEILAGDTGNTFPDPTDNQGSLFQVLSGTSMASPHVAAAAALVRQAHPNWTPGQIHSALMTTATMKKLYREDAITLAGPFDVGSGRLDVARAADPGLTFDATKQEFLDHQFDLWTVNYPSLYVPSMGTALTVQRTIKNELAKTTKFKLTIQGPADLGVTVPAEIVLAPGAFATFDLTVNAGSVPAGQVRHAVLLIKGKTVARFPITIVRG